MLRFIFTISIFISFTQIITAQTDKITNEKLQPITISAFPLAKPDENPEAVKFRNQGISFVVERKLEQAIEAFTQAIKLDPKSAENYNRRGAVYSDAGKQDLAIADFTKAIKLNPKFDIAYMNRGAIYMMYKKEYKLAIADFTKLIELNPQNWLSYTFREMAYDKSGQKDLSDADRQKIKELRNKEKKQ